jgi:hypothetical protein
MITGLVGITPAAGFVAGWGAIIIGFCTGTIPWVSMNIVGTRWFIFKRHVDDTLALVLQPNQCNKLTDTQESRTRTSWQVFSAAS